MSTQARQLPRCETWMPVTGKFKTYECDVNISYWEDGTVVWSKGHHAHEVFMIEARRAWRAESGDDLANMPKWLGDRPKHEWWATRVGWGLTGGGGGGGLYSFLHDIVDPWARGAYPVTVVRV